MEQTELDLFPKRRRGINDPKPPREQPEPQPTRDAWASWPHPRAGDPPAPQQLMLAGMRGMRHVTRYPHGYTPERIQAVRAAMPPTGVTGIPTHGGSAPLTAGFQGIHAHEREQVARLIARSSVPTEDLAGLRSISTRAKLPENLAGLYKGGHISIADHIGGSQRDTSLSPGTPFGNRFVRRSYAVWNENILVHEIGHHVGRHEGVDVARLDQWGGERPWERVGRQEGEADNYAMAHVNRSTRGERPAMASGYEADPDKAFDHYEAADAYFATRNSGSLPQTPQPFRPAPRPSFKKRKV